MIDNRLSLSGNIAAVTRACSFFLYNIWRIRPFLTTYSTQLLVQAMVLSRLDNCNSAGWPPDLICYQTLTTDPECCGTKHSHVTPLLTDLHWLPVMARIKLVLAYQAVKGSAPAYIQKLPPDAWCLA